MKYSEKVYIGALQALATLRQSATDRGKATIDFVAEAVAEKGDRERENANVDCQTALDAHWRTAEHDKAMAELLECRARLQAFEKALETGQLVRAPAGKLADICPAVVPHKHMEMVDLPGGAEK